jgi:methionine sulfoxide reductase heme-binding subunit
MIFILALALINLSIMIKSAQAQQPQMDYGDQPIVDSDLDGLTDEGEKQIFNTDPNNSDTDGDGYLDGTEIIHKTNPLDVSDPLAKETQVLTNPKVEPSWGWYMTRAAGLIGFGLLATSIFFGAGIGIPGLQRKLATVRGAQIHGWISLMSLIFVAIHGLSLLFDKYLGFGLMDIFVPLAASFNPTMVALGTIGFYIMLLLVLTSYFRKRISPRMWRVTHFLNLILWVIVVIHALAIGTDMKNPAVRNIFIAINVFLALMLIISLFFKILNAIRRRSAKKNHINEDKSQSDSRILEK